MPSAQFNTEYCQIKMTLNRIKQARKIDFIQDHQTSF